MASVPLQSEAETWRRSAERRERVENYKYELRERAQAQRAEQRQRNAAIRQRAEEKAQLAAKEKLEWLKAVRAELHVHELLRTDGKLLKDLPYAKAIALER